MADACNTFRHNVSNVNLVHHTVHEVEYAVSPFNANELQIDFLKTPPLTKVPMGTIYNGYTSPDMDLNSYDIEISPRICLWMNGVTVGGGELAMSFRNDLLFGVYHHLARMERYSRNKHEDSTAVMTRSDRTDIHEGVPLVLIEEKESSIEDALADISRKFRWLPHFERLPFIFGIACTANYLNIYKIHRNLALDKVFEARLMHNDGRWDCVVAAINIARTLLTFTHQKWVIPVPLRFDIWHKRNAKNIGIGMQFVEIEFEDSNQYVRMQDFYRKTASVPHLEHLYCGDVGPFNELKQRIRLVPVGSNHKPSSAKELSLAIRQICKCLFKLHALKYVHCDIRWSNIVNVFGDSCLIDCEYACSLNETELLIKRSAETCRKRYVLDTSKPWSAMFDLYQVGLLIKDSNVHIDVNVDSNLVELRELLLTKSFSTKAVKKALAKV